MDELIYISEGSAFMFYLVMSVILLVAHKNRMRVMAGVNMLMCALECIKDYCAFLWLPENFYGDLGNLLTILDILTVPACVLLIKEILQSGWITLKNVLIQTIPFLLLQVIYILFPTVEVFYGIMAYSFIYILYHAFYVRNEVKMSRKKLREQYSYIDNLNLGWTVQIFGAFFGMTLLWALNLIVESDIIFVICYWLSVFIWALQLYFIHKQEYAMKIFARYDAMADNEDAAGSILTMPGLNALMLEKKYYMRPKLTVKELASEIGTNRTYLSNYLNNKLHVDFFRFVNNYRLDHALELLTTTDYNLDVISELSGFNSLSTFRRSFVSKYGCTPVEYRNKKLKQPRGA